MKTHSPNPAPMLSPQAVTWAGLLCNGALGAAKVLAGLLCHSQAILADGLHSASDLITDVVVLAGLRVADKPADDCHPYGHRRVATLVAMFVGGALIGADRPRLLIEALKIVADSFDPASTEPAES